LTRALAVRARISTRPGRAPERFADFLMDDLARRGPLSAERIATHWGDTAALTRLAAAKRKPFDRDLAAGLSDYHRRLGASAASMAALDRLASGEAVCTVAGQQPGPLGGPLYSLHKTAATAGMAAEVESRTGAPCVPVFWMHGEDSDFAEIGSATIADAGLTLHEFSLPDSAHRDGALVGSIAPEILAALEREALPSWSGLSGEPAVRALLEHSHRGARDLGEAYAALMLALFAEQGLVVVDPRLPAFRAAARPLIDRYLEQADTLRGAAVRAGEWLESALGRRPLADSSLDSFVFAIEDGVRRKLSPAEARAARAPRTLSPSVALRPAVQDGVLPTVAMAVGPGEAAYLLQLREVFEGLGVRASCPVPRLSATWLPPAAVQLLEAAGASCEALVTASDGVLRELAERSVPAGTLDVFQRAHAAALDGLDRIGAASREVDASLPQMVDSARAKVDFQYQRLREGLVGKVQKKLERQHPEWQRLRYYLMPGDKWQERRLSTLEVAAYRGGATGAEVCELAREHARRVAEGVHEHAVVEL
ncbi:MAG: bacillithiol biosynthesis cysteine-adding enzyme BshC, partial [Candidatus Eiseniibacteriota bacterium]